MKIDKHIEEMAKVIKDINANQCLRIPCNQCKYKSLKHIKCKETLIASCLSKMNYRKASEVAREIFEEIERMCIDTFGNFNYRVFAELKKKYSEEK